MTAPAFDDLGDTTLVPTGEQAGRCLECWPEPHSQDQLRRHF